jgi:hypothetical protein
MRKCFDARLWRAPIAWAMSGFVRFSAPMKRGHRPVVSHETLPMGRFSANRRRLVILPRSTTPDADRFSPHAVGSRAADPAAAPRGLPGRASALPQSGVCASAHPKWETHRDLVRDALTGGPCGPASVYPPRVPERKRPCACSASVTAWAANSLESGHPWRRKRPSSSERAGSKGDFRTGWLRPA